METEGSLPHLQPTTCPYPEPDQSSPFPTSHFLKIHPSILVQSRPRCSKWSLTFTFPHQSTVCSCPRSMGVTCPCILFFL